MPEMPDLPGFEKSTPCEEVAKMDEDARKARLKTAADTIQAAKWEKEIPAEIKVELEMIFAILDGDKTGKISLEEWKKAGLEEDVFNQVDKSGTITFDTLIFAADEDTFGDSFGSAFGGFSMPSMSMPEMPDIKMPDMPEMTVPGMSSPS